jgi:hypothetical protein
MDRWPSSLAVAWTYLVLLSGVHGEFSGGMVNSPVAMVNADGPRPWGHKQQVVGLVVGV